MNGQIDLPDDDPAIVRLMIHFFYHLDYIPVTSPEPGGSSNIKRETSADVDDGENDQRPSKHRKLDKSGTKVEETAKEKPASFLSTHAKFYALGEEYGIKGLKSLATEKFDCEAGSQLESEDFLVAIQ